MWEACRVNDDIVRPREGGRRVDVCATPTPGDALFAKNTPGHTADIICRKRWTAFKGALSLEDDLCSIHRIFLLGVANPLIVHSQWRREHRIGRRPSNTSGRGMSVGIRGVVAPPATVAVEAGVHKDLVPLVNHVSATCVGTRACGGSLSANLARRKGRRG